jgi:hypothetical protein
MCREVHRPTSSLRISYYVSFAAAVVALREADLQLPTHEKAKLLCDDSETLGGESTGMWLSMKQSDAGRNGQLFGPLQYCRLPVRI